MLEILDLNRLPIHIGIIMDGNGRWAQKRNLPRSMGHKAGVEALRNIVKKTSDLGIKFLTVYAFSSENWKRPKKEVSFLMNLLVTYLKKEVKELDENNVRIMSIGNLNKLPDIAIEELQSAKDKTKRNSGLTLTLALNYGFRNDLVNAVRKIISNENSMEDISEELIKQNLSTSFLPDPDLIIRTSNELRLSNFMMYEASYSELYFTEVLWPDFKENNLYEALLSYQNRNRRYGGF